MRFPERDGLVAASVNEALLYLEDEAASRPLLIKSPPSARTLMRAIAESLSKSSIQVHIAFSTARRTSQLFDLRKTVAICSSISLRFRDLEL